MIKNNLYDKNERLLKGFKQAGEVIGKVLTVSVLGAIKYSKILFKIIKESKK